MGLSKLKRMLNQSKKTKKIFNNISTFKCRHVSYEQTLDRWHCDIKQRYMPDSDLNKCECLCYNGIHPCDCHSLKRPEHKIKIYTD